MKSHSDAILLNLGCGLDTRISRIRPPTSVDGFDVDFLDFIQERRNFFSNGGGGVTFRRP